MRRKPDEGLGEVEIGRMNQKEYMNAKQVYDAFGITRSILGRLVEAGRVTRKVLTDDVASLNLYKVADIEKCINGGANAD